MRNKSNNLSKEISDLNIHIDSIEKARPFVAPLSDIEGRIRDLPLKNFKPPADAVEVKITIQQTLFDFNATIKANPNLTEKELLFRFPEFNNDKRKLRAAFDYSATLNSGKYKNIGEFNYKFPEFFGVSNDSLELKKSDMERLDSIEIKMLNNNETDATIKFVQNDFLQKYGIKKIRIQNKTLEELQKSKTELNQNLKETETKLFCKEDTQEYVFWLAIIFFSLLYPFRFIYFLLKWAFKTVKQKE